MQKYSWKEQDRETAVAVLLFSHLCCCCKGAEAGGENRKCGEGRTDVGLGLQCSQVMQPVVPLPVAFCA